MAQQQQYSPGVLVGNYCEEILLREQQQHQSQSSGGEGMETERGQEMQGASAGAPGRRRPPRTEAASHFAPPSREATLAAASAANDARWGSVVRAEGREAAEALFGVREAASEAAGKKRAREEEEARERAEAAELLQEQRRQQRQRERQRRLPRSSSPPREQLRFRPPVAQKPSFKPRGEATAVWDESLAQMNLRRP